MSESVAIAEITENQDQAAEPDLAGPDLTSAELASPDLTSAELLVEEVSIDGMCGVY
jgi:mycofactocin precursor